jgi:hypothetical protein
MAQFRDSNRILRNVMRHIFHKLRFGAKYLHSITPRSALCKPLARALRYTWLSRPTERAMPPIRPPPCPPRTAPSHRHRGIRRHRGRDGGAPRTGRAWRDAGGARCARAALLRAQGITCRENGHTILAHPAIVPALPEAPFDLLVLAVKAGQLPEAVAALPSTIGAHTPVLPLVNGIPWWFHRDAQGASSRSARWTRRASSPGVLRPRRSWAAWSIPPR